MGTVALTSNRGFAVLPAFVSTLALAVPGGLAGQQPYAPTRAPDVHFVPTDTTKVREMLTAAQVGSKDLVYDLGCGDGRIVISAVKQYGARGVCVDIDPVRIKESRSNADTAGVTNRIEFVEGDLFEVDLSNATVVTLYLLPSLNQRLRPKLFKDVRPGTRIVSNAFDMGDWKADRTLNIKTFSGSQSYAYLWIIPADVSGEWRLKPEGGSGKEYTLDLKQKYQEVSGTASSSGKAIRLSSLTLKGDRLSFVLRDGAGEGQGLEFAGEVHGDRASGTAKGKDGGWSWTAVRTKPGSRPDLRPTEIGGSAAGGSAEREPAGFAAAPEVTEWTVPWAGTRPRDPFVDGKGRVWFVGQQGNYVAYLEPKSGRFERYEIEEGTHPHNLVVAPDGMIWFTGNRNGRLVKLDPATRKLTNYPMPDPKVDDPHTMILDRAGNAWFTAQNSAVVGRLDGKTGKIRLWPTGGGTRPYGIEADADQRPWFVLFGTNEVGTIDPATMEMRRFTLPEGARPRRLVVTGEAIWYADYARGFLGRLDPATGKVREFAMPAGTVSLPYAMAGDDKGKIWLAETGVRPNRLVAFDPKAGGFSDSVATEGGEEANTIRHMVFHKPTREMWYGTDRNTIGRLQVP